MKTLSHALFLALLMGATACNLGPGSGDDDDASGDDDDASGPVDTTVSALNAGEVISGTEVIVSGTITTPFYSDEDDNEAYFWIQDGTGTGSGIAIFTYPDVIAEIEFAAYAGDNVTVTGIYDIPFGFSQVRVSALDGVQVTGTGMLPEPYLVEASEIEAGFGDPGLYGLIVAIEDVVADTAPGWDNYFDWEADGVIIDSMFHTPDVEAGFAIDAISGVFHLNFGDASIHPRWASDLTFSYPGCDALSSPSIIQQVNCHAFEEDEDIELEGMVVISGELWFGDSFYVQDPSGADYSGIQVYCLDEDIIIPPIGAVLDLEGEFEEYKGNTEIVLWEDGITDTGETATVTPIEVADACTLSEAHEGMLVEIGSVTVTQSSDGAEFGYYEVDGCPLVVIDSSFWDDNKAFNSDTGGAGVVEGLVGVVADEYDLRTINPRSTNDWTSWTPGS